MLYISSPRGRGVEHGHGDTSDMIWELLDHLQRFKGQLASGHSESFVLGLVAWSNWTIHDSQSSNNNTLRRPANV